MAIRNFKVHVYTKYDDLTLLDDLTPRLTAGSYSTILHGGCHQATIVAPSSQASIWLYLQAEARAGRHFTHLLITEGLDWRWEGRIVDIGINGNRDQVWLSLTAFGYASSMRDVEIKSDIVYSTKTPDFMIKDLLDTYCLDINADQAGIAAVSGDMSPTITARKYSMDAIVQDIAPLGDDSNNQYWFTIGEDRKPFYKQRDLSSIDFRAYLADMDSWAIRQGTQNSRQTIRANDGTTTHNAQNAQKWPSGWPSRDLIIDVPPGVGATVADDAATRSAAEKGKVQNMGTRFIISRRPERLVTVNPPLGSPRAAITAGKVMEVADLFPVSRNSVALDQLRTFYLGRTLYDMVRDVVTVEPDDPPTHLDILLARKGLELKR